MAGRPRKAAIDQARLELATEQIATGNRSGKVVICHGEPRCDRMGVSWEPCEWCYRLDPFDKRTTDKVLQDMAVEH